MIGTTAFGLGKERQWSLQEGKLDYYEVCKNIGSYWTRVMDTTQGVPHAYYSNQWVGYDDMSSVQRKIENILQEKLLGVMIDDLGMDDFADNCGDGRFPLLSKINDVVSKTTTPTPIRPTFGPFTARPTTTKATTTTCDKNVYYQCLWGIPVERRCNWSLVWNQVGLRCDWA